MVVAGSGAVYAPVQAQYRPDVLESQIIQDLVPDIASETEPASSLVEIDVHSGAPEVAIADESGSEDVNGVSFAIDYATELYSEGQGITALETTSESVAAHVQATGFGARVLTVIADARAPERYDYTFEVPVTTELVEAGDGDGYYLIGDDELYGSLLEPWAIDAAGNPVPTSYTWSGGVLTQHVDLDMPGIAFPVVADPAWTYAYKFPTGAKTANSARAFLKRCFNCYFPVSGAPKAFPKPGQLLPLKAGVFNMECRFKAETYDNQRRWIGFRFDATKNHVDKLGSYISFGFEPIGGKNYLITRAYIVNDAFWIKNNLYRSGAIQKWTKFADNIKNG